LCFGSSGRKGPGEDLTILKSTVAEAIKFIPTNCIITKHAVSRTPDAGFNWMVLVDSSQRALGGLDLAIQLAQPSDYIYVLHARRENKDSTQLEAKYRALIAER
jgi:hypothetical protein